MKAATLGGYTLVVIGLFLGSISILSALISIPMFLKLNTAETYSWGFIIGRVLMVFLLFLLAKVAIAKGKSLKIKQVWRKHIPAPLKPDF